jgi:hypothetical protein
LFVCSLLFALSSHRFYFHILITDDASYLGYSNTFCTSLSGVFFIFASTLNVCLRVGKYREATNDTFIILSFHQQQTTAQTCLKIAQNVDDERQWM